MASTANATADGWLLISNQFVVGKTKITSRRPARFCC